MTNDRNDILAVIPTYNNEKTVARVIADVRRYCAHVLVVNDGSTDSTAQILAAEGVGTISYAPNRGKGYAIRRALRYAEEHGYRYMITIDSDGQHFASDIPKFVEEIEKTPDALLVGARNLRSDNMPARTPSPTNSRTSGSASRPACGSTTRSRDSGSIPYGG